MSMIETPRGPPPKPPKLLEISPQEQKNVNQFFSKLQVGDLCFAKILEYAIGLFGQTKAGKTTLAHYLINNPLVGNSKGSYELIGGVKFLEALIGHSHISQTQIPNQIQKKVQDKMIHILDCPGYSDSKGCQMIIANGYFHYRIFSKVKNLKFVIAFDYNFMGDVYEKPTNTLRQFFDSFKDYHQIRTKIIEATSFVFTKLNRQGQSEQQVNANILAKLIALRDCGLLKNSQHRKEAQDLIKAIITEKRYFYFEKAKENTYASQNNHLLHEINSRTKFWERQVNSQDQQADLTHIQMTLGYRARDLANSNEVFRKEFAVLTQVFEQRIKRSFMVHECSLSKITNQFLINSIMGSGQQKSFYEDHILKFVQQFNVYTTNAFNSKLEYQNKRKKIKESVLSVPHESIDKSHVQNIQKLQICKMIIQMVQNFEVVFDKNGIGRRNLQDFKKLAKRILNIFVQFKKIKFFRTKERKSQLQAQYYRKIQQFIYIVFRFLEEIRIFKIIFSIENAEKPDMVSEQIGHFLNISEVVDNYIQSIDTQSLVPASFGQKNMFARCKLTYLANHLQVSTEESQYYYNELLKYFCVDEIEKKGEKQLEPIQIKAKQKIDRIREQKIKLSKLSPHEKVITLLDFVFNKLALLEQQNYQDEQDYTQVYIDSVNKLGDELTNFKTKAQSIAGLKYAIILFTSTNNVYRTIQCYKELTKKEKYDYKIRKQAQELKDILIEFAGYASTHGRIELAIEVYQHAYSIIDWMFDKSQDDFRTIRRQLRQEISQKIGMLGIDKRYSPSTHYYDCLMKKKLFTKIETGVLESIRMDFKKK